MLKEINLSLIVRLCLASLQIQNGCVCVVNVKHLSYFQQWRRNSSLCKSNLKAFTRLQTIAAEIREFLRTDRLTNKSEVSVCKICWQIEATGSGFSPWEQLDVLPPQYPSARRQSKSKRCTGKQQNKSLGSSRVGLSKQDTSPGRGRPRLLGVAWGKTGKTERNCFLSHSC